MTVCTQARPRQGRRGRWFSFQCPAIGGTEPNALHRHDRRRRHSRKKRTCRIVGAREAGIYTAYGGPPLTSAGLPRCSTPSPSSTARPPRRRSAARRSRRGRSRFADEMQRPSRRSATWACSRCARGLTCVDEVKNARPCGMYQEPRQSSSTRRREHQALRSRRRGAAPVFRALCPPGKLVLEKPARLAGLPRAQEIPCSC